MRTIIFRGFNRKNKQWLYGFYLQNRGGHFICPDEFATGKTWEDYEIDPETLGQFTGLKDKNGKEIYEGDLVHVNCFGNRRVDYQCGEWVLTACNDGWIALSDLDDMVGIGDDLLTVEVIGNIHDNSDLLQTTD